MVKILILISSGDNFNTEKSIPTWLHHADFWQYKHICTYSHNGKTRHDFLQFTYPSPHIHPIQSSRIKKSTYFHTKLNFVTYLSSFWVGVDFGTGWIWQGEHTLLSRVLVNFSTFYFTPFHSRFLSVSLFPQSPHGVV